MKIEQNKKRVLLLLRDSTLKQDISMQRIACTQFVGMHPDWEIVDEITEEGISGFKKSAKQRDGLQEAQDRALNGKYDILLVFMFDRIGRRESETPFVVEWFVLNGVEVWSTQEGQQKFENHTDNLVNFLRFWQAEGESRKISARTRTKSGQMVEEGRYRGGPVPYGYKIVKQGRVNRKGHEVHEIVIDEQEADIVRLMYQKCACEGFGTRRIAGFLNDMGSHPREQSHIWINTSIQRILRNPIYLGILKSGKTQSEIFEHLQIIDIERFDKVQKIMDERKDRHNDKNTTPMKTKSKSLLSGNLFCGYCGLRMVQSSSKKTNTLANGSKKTYNRHYYKCYGKSRFKECDGPSTYTVSTLDNAVNELVLSIFKQAKSIPSHIVIGQQSTMQCDILKRQQDSAKQTLDKKKSDLSKLENELLNVLAGNSVFDKDTLSKLIKKTQDEITQASEHYEKFTSELTEEREIESKIKQRYDSLITWADLYQTCSHEERKMILSELIGRIEVYKDYELKIEFNLSYQDLFVSLFGEDEMKNLIA